MLRALVLLVLCGFTGQAQAARHEEIRPMMGTLATVTVWAETDSLAIAAADTAFAVFVRCDSLLSTWNGNSPLSRLNRAPNGEWVDVGREVVAVLEESRRMVTVSAGAFHPAVLPLVKLWGFRGGEPGIPAATDLAQTLELVSLGMLQIDGRKIRRQAAGGVLDFGGIAKGYALDEAAAALQGMGVAGAVLDLGGNLLAFGDGPAAQVAVTDPLAPGTVALTIPLADGAVATSGQYERFVEIEGRKFGHILDPRNGWPVAPGLSATVRAPLAIHADALATAAVVLGRERGLALLDSLPDVEGLLIDASGIHATSGLTPEAPSR